MYPGVLYYGPFFFTAALVFAVALFAFTRRHVRSGWQLTLTCLTAAGWAASEGLFYLGFDHRVYIFLLKVQHLFIDVMPIMTLLFILSFFNLDTWRPKTRNTVFFTLYAGCIILVWSNPYHHWVFTSYYIIHSAPFPMFGIVHAPLWWVIIVFQYSVLTLCMTILIHQVFRSSGLYRNQALLLLASFAVVCVLNVIYVTGNSPIPNVDYSPLGFSLVAAATAVGFFRFNLLDISPVAKAEIFRGVKDPILVLDNKDRVIELNPAAEGLFETGFSEVIGKEVWDLLGRHAQLMEVLKKQGQAETALEMGDPKRFYDISASPLHDKKDHLLGRVIVLRDITQRKQAEQEKNRLESELRHVQKMEALGTLAGGIAHDFNNILVAILGYSDLALKDCEQGKPNTSRIIEIVKAGGRAKDLVTQILAFSRKLKPELNPIDLNQVVIQTKKMLERTIPRMINIELRLQGDLRLINADPGQISQVLLNLGTNAKDAMADGGELVITTENTTLERNSPDLHPALDPGEYVLLTVSDTGHGMDQETQEHIFEPFFTKKEVGRGTGLGLATVYGIVQNHGGHISCASSPGKGTTISIYFPASRIKKRIGTAEEAKAQSPDGGHETVLFVDDEKPIRDLGQEVLAYKGYQVLLAETGEQALDVYREHGKSIDLVVLDISMPGMGGHKCLKELISLDPEVRVLIISGYSLNGQLKDIMASGAAGFVPKPFSISDLLTNIRTALDR